MHNRLSGVLAAAALAMWSFPGLARAETFDFSYTFGDGGGVVTGALEGTVQPNMNTVLVSAVDSLVVFGEPITPPLYVPPPAVVSFDGSVMNFVALATDENHGFSADLFIENVIAASPSGVVDFETYDPAHWTLAAVPEPATWVLMLAGFAGLGFVGYRRQQWAKRYPDTLVS